MARRRDRDNAKRMIADLDAQKSKDQADVTKLQGMLAKAANGEDYDRFKKSITDLEAAMAQRIKKRSTQDNLIANLKTADAAYSDKKAARGKADAEKAEKKFDADFKKAKADYTSNESALANATKKRAEFKQKYDAEGDVNKKAGFEKELKSWGKQFNDFKVKKQRLTDMKATMKTMDDGKKNALTKAIADRKAKLGIDFTAAKGNFEAAQKGYGGLA